MGKKKPFIDKKNASTYHVVRRSQRDVGTEASAETLSDFVLMPSPDNFKQENGAIGTGGQTDASADGRDNAGSMGKLRSRMASAGLLDTTESMLSRYTKPITGTGTFVSSDGGRAPALMDPRARPIEEATEVNEVNRMLDSIALTPGCMDDDVAQALFGDFEEGDFEEILDDFCLTAAQEPDEEEEEEFDYDAHIKNLIERAKKQENGAAEHTRIADDDFFHNTKPLHMRNIEEEEDDAIDNGYDSLDREFDGDNDDLDTPSGVVPALDPDAERALQDKFEQTLAEYDSDDVGDLDEECEEIGGQRPLDGDVQVEAALDEFLEERRDEVFMEGTRHLEEKQRKGGSSYAALVGKRLVGASELSEELEENLAFGNEKPVQEVLDEADVLLANPEMEPPAEEVLIDGKSYFSETKRNPWDCESILSTYSNLDNNPVTIGHGRRRTKKKKKKSQSSQMDEPIRIVLSNKTGLPMGVLPVTEKDDDTLASLNRGEARQKRETAEEKKARKLAVKKERQIARIQKKMMKEAFQEEFTRRTGDVVSNDVGGKSVFRYS